MRKQFLADESIFFPFWVKLPTRCATRTFSTVVPRSERYPSTRHGAIRLEGSYVNRPVIKAPRKGLPGYYVKWTDMDAVRCPETGYAECAERHCGLHYMDAPLRLEATK